MLKPTTEMLQEEATKPTDNAASGELKETELEGVAGELTLSRCRRSCAVESVGVLC